MIARRAQSFTLASGAAIALAWPDKAPNQLHSKDEMTCRASAGEDAPGVGARLQVGSGFSGECVREGKLLRCDDAEGDARVDRDSCQRLGIRSMVAVPVKDHESVVGMIEIFSSLPKAFTDVDVVELQNLAQLVAKAVEKAQDVVRVKTPSCAPENKSEIAGSNHLDLRLPTTAPNLLLQLEPAPRAFFGNLIDILLFRTVTTVPVSAAPDLFWKDVFVSSRMPWKRFLQSALWHVVALAVVWNLSQDWAMTEKILRRTTSHDSHVTYYKSSVTFPTTGGHRPVVRARPKARTQTAARPVIAVRAESRQPAVDPPAIKLPMGGRLSLAAWKPAILAMPRPPAPAAPALNPASRQATLASPGRPQLVQASVIAPPPQISAVFGQPTAAAPSSLVVAPPPRVESSMRTRGNVTIGGSAVVGPAPGMPLREPSKISAITMGGGGAGVVVGPPPPMPMRERHNTSAMALGSADGVVGPAPGLPLHEPSNVAGAVLNGTGTSIVPPPPSLDGSAALGRGRAGSLPGSGSQIAGPPPSIGGADAFAGGTARAAMSIPPTVAPPPPRKIIEEPSGPGPQELPLRLIGLALALPSSSYFSNYEVFIAERRIAKDESQLIKLVYESRPYQRRMSEYGVNDSKLYKVRVKRDATCDETALQVVGNHYSEMRTSAGHPALNSIDGNSILPCYRTTVDEYRKALSRGR
jgi:L-methionine (R)-S-oxide reductase